MIPIPFLPIHCLDSDHRPFLLRMDPFADGYPNTYITITDRNKVFIVEVLTNHIKTVDGNSSQTTTSNRRKLHTDALKLLRAKNTVLRSPQESWQKGIHQKALKKEEK
ncbi:hypothetical protein EVAR_95165_1 [Eumeta japonica]|uniref:Uncharacterized protein n=1 Tax=Eumeta variegata TaxID=151549 RepID=A0A4C1VHG2_EUMVA|nr:hypothetical protein EVAR_95165_1 [Eumeta japonica]